MKETNFRRFTTSEISNVYQIIDELASKGERFQVLIDIIPKEHLSDLDSHDQIYSTDKNKMNKDLEYEVSDVLHKLGCPAHIKGYRYLKYAIMKVVEDPSYIDGVTKLLYPEIASKYDDTPSRVERAIRHAVTISYTRGNIDYNHEVFGCTVDPLRDKPTNSEFIAIVADTIRLRRKKENI